MKRFEEAIWTMVPIYDSKWSYPGFHEYTWLNAERGSCFHMGLLQPIRNRLQKITKEGKEHILCVTDSYEQALRAATFVGEHKRLKRSSAGRCREENEGYYKNATVVDIDFSKMYGKAEEILARVSEKHTVLFSGLHQSKVLEQNLQYILCCPADVCIVMISKELLRTSSVQKLIYRGGYDIVHFPDLEKDYYQKLAEKIYTQPLFIDIFKAGKFPNDVSIQEAMAESDYIMKGDVYELKKSLIELETMSEGRFLAGDIARFYDMCEEHDWNIQSVFKGSTLRNSADLENMIGLEQIKVIVRRHIAINWLTQGRSEQKSRNYMLVGNPGCGKTESAKLLYEVLRSEGIITGNFVNADRKDVIGSYVGQTAPKVAELFDRARRGILFFDESGLFLQKGTGGFVNEAIKEIVRYMEEGRDVMVIFALYPGEKDAFLELDAGLSSRIDQVIYFEDYSVEEMCDIADSMSKNAGYSLQPACRTQIAEYVQERRNTLKAQFGNAREMRKLVEHAIEEAELRIYEETKDRAEVNPEIIEQDITCAIEQLKNCSPTVNKPHRIGFKVEGNDELVQKILCQVS